MERSARRDTISTSPNISAARSMKDVTSSGVFIINPRTEPPVGSIIQQNSPSVTCAEARPPVWFYAVPKSASGGRGSDMAYEVEGQLLEVCTCNILCPCWVGEDPDNG